MKKNKFVLTFSEYWYIFALYLLLGGGFIYFLRFYIDGIDMLNYISISKKYIHGSFYDAINDYWSPMIPWLLMPFLVFKPDPFLAFHILQLIIGLFTIKILIDFIAPVKIKVWMKHVLHFSFIPLILCYGQLYGSPDLLFLTVLLYYLKAISNENYITNSDFGFVTGLLAGILYLVKAYGFPFISVHFVCINAIYYFQNRHTNSKIIIAKNFSKGFILFLLITATWIGFQSYKNKEFTISGSGKYNFALFGPEYSRRPECLLCHPAHEQGLFNPPDSGAVNITESPSSFHIRSWNPFESKTNFHHFLVNIKNNIESIYYLDFQRQIGTVLLLTLLIFIFTGGRLKNLPSKTMILFVTWIIYDIGYINVIVNHRYIWINTAIFIILFCYLLEKLCYKNKTMYVISSLLFFSFIFFFVKRPVKELLFLRDKDSSVSEMLDLTLHPLATLEKSIQPHKDFFHAISEIQQRKEIHGRIANRQEKGRENYMATAVICFYTGNKHYGELTDRIIKREGYKQLNDFNIDYFFAWNPIQDSNTIVISNPVFTDSITGLRVYKVGRK